MNFDKFRKALAEHFAKIVEGATHLFEVNLDKGVLWEKYLSSFPAGTNELYRERTEHDCCACRHFVKSFGNVVVIKNNQVYTIWDLELEDAAYQAVADALSAFVKAHVVSNVYVSKFDTVGVDFSHESLESGEILTWTHFYLELPSRFVDKSQRSIGDIQGEYRDPRNVFKRSLDEITQDSVITLLELIAQNSLYKGEESEGLLQTFLKYKKEYDKLSVDEAMLLTSGLGEDEKIELRLDAERIKGLYAWENSVVMSEAVSKIRGTSIGTLLVDISNDMELNEAVKAYGKKVDPLNYKHPKNIYTKKQLDDANKTMEAEGYKPALARQFATPDDITVNNILFMNKDSAKRISGAGDIFAQMEKEAVVNPRKYAKAEEISAQDFIDNVLPFAKEIEAFVENKHDKNFVSLIAPVNKDAKHMFKWNNGLSWAYTGNITDSSMKANVKAAGGNVSGVLRFSIQWNESGHDESDMDAYCIEPNGNKIYFRSCKAPSVSALGGQLDVDNRYPMGKVVVENITYAEKSKMRPGVYTFYTNQYDAKGSKGFKAEVEFDGQIFACEYNKPMRKDENVYVAEVTLSEDGEFTIKEVLPGSSTITSRDIWGVSTNQFVPVSVVCYSPNYFDAQDGIGHRHMFLMLKGCVNTESPNGFYNEYIKEDLIKKHKNVFECLGAKCHVEDSDDQLSGIGFSMTKRAELTVKVKGNTERILKIKF